jgi:hypothetical protein
MMKKITFLHTLEQLEQAPHRDYSTKTLTNHKNRYPIVPWALDMPLTESGLLLNVWSQQDLEKVMTGENTSEWHRLPYTLYVSFRQVLLFSGNTVHGGGFQRDGDGCFRLHMYLSLAPPGETHAALEEQDKVNLTDNNGIKYSTILLKSDYGKF